MTELREYNPIKVVGSFATPAGSIDILDATIDGEFLSEAPDNTRWAREFDQFGNATRTRKNNRGGAMAVTISASSPTNAKLSALVQADDVSSGVVGMLKFKDLNGNTVVECDGAFLEDMPPIAFGSDRGARTWTWQCAAIRKFVGGHNLA